MPIKTNKLNIFLVKREFTSFGQIVGPETSAIQIPNVGTFYSESSQPHTPDWVKNFFGNSIDTTFLHLVSSSARGLLLIEIEKGQEKYVFAVTFGFGRHLLKDDVIEEQFGLKVVLNSVDHKFIRGMDKTTLGSTPKQTREQMSREAEVADFGLDVEQDLVSSVTGKSRFFEFGRTISGRDGLSVSVKVNTSNVKDFLKFCLDRYKSEEYKTNFGWIDQIKFVRDSSMIASLDAKLECMIAQLDVEKIWMAAPEIIDWNDASGFRYQQPKRGELKTDLDLHDFLAFLGHTAPTILIFKETSVHLISSMYDNPINRWSAYKCLCAEVDHENTVYVLNAGNWYEVIQDFAEQVKQSFESLPEYALQLPDYSHGSEAAYNLALINHIPNSFCMDAKMIPYGGGKSSIEFCDVATDDKKLIHVKRYGGSSSLSHLFAQGIVSGELFLQEEGFRKELNKKLPQGRKLQNYRTRPVADQYEVVFAIISKSQNPLNIPFFSKVTLRNARRRLEAYGYTVSKRKIQQV